MAGLTVDRVDFLRRRIDVAQILVETDTGLTFGPPKTKRSRGLVSFPAFLADELAHQVAEYPDRVQSRRLLFHEPAGQSPTAQLVPSSRLAARRVVPPDSA